MFKIGDRVRIKRGAITGNNWSTTSINAEKNRVKGTVRSVGSNVSVQWDIQEQGFNVGHYDLSHLEKVTNIIIAVQKTKERNKNMAKAKDGEDKKLTKVERIQAAILENTQDWRKEVFETGEKQTEKAKTLSDLLSAMTLGKEDKERMAKVIALTSGEEVKIEKEDDLEFRPLTAIVLTKADKHGYETGKVLLSIGDGTAVDESGKVGNYIPGSRKIVRPATDEEMKAVPETQIKGFMKEAQIVFA